jgi:hypothetical protein
MVIVCTLCCLHDLVFDPCSHKAVAERWPLPKQLQIGKSQSNEPAFQTFQRFSHSLMTTIVSKIQLCKAWMALVAL